MTSLAHEALMYRDAPSYLDGCLPFIDRALTIGEPVLVAVPKANGDLLRRELGTRDDRVRILDMTIDGRNPGRIIPAVLHAFIEEHPGQPVHIIGEHVWPTRSAAEYPACMQHEAMINSVFDDAQASILCAYHVHDLEPEVLADAARTHPVLVNAGQRQDSRAYTPPRAVMELFNRPLPAAPTHAALMVFDNVDDLLELRNFVDKAAREIGLVFDRSVDLQVAANELATNTIRHSGGHGVVRVWADDGHIICDVSDGGHIPDPFAGRVPPPLNSESGRGLLLVNYLCDLVRIYTTPGATSVRVYVRLS
jgi:anti-sigma regulatory factor (Ser/Thr protein kinase)